MATDECGNLEIQREINQLLEARNVMLAKQSDLLRDQSQISSKISELLENTKSPFEGNDISSILDGASKSAEDATDGVGDFNNAIKKADKDLPKLKKSGEGSFGGIGKVASKLLDVSGGIVGVVSSISTAVLGIGSALISIPMGILENLQKEAADLANRSLAIRDAMEEVREQFGSLASNEGKAVMDSYSDLRKESGSLAGSGRSLSSIYGYGPEGLAAAMKDMAETANAMGPVFSALGDQMAENAASITIMRKGLGLANEDMKALGMQALARGENINDSLKEIGSLSVQMGQKFGISSKLIGKDMGYMTANIGKFGSMTKAQMATAAVYTRKLGIEVKDLEGLIGAFDDFETAATNASKLAQSFGMNIDAMEMMKEKDPTKRLDNLRSAFAATGKSIKDMTRQEKELLAQTAGLDSNMVEAALSAENMGMSYDEISAAAEGAADKQLSQEEIMQNMADNIKKAFAPIEYVAGLFANFMKGFVNGIMRSKPMMALLNSMAEVIKDVYQLGLDVGKMFISVFPGVSKIFSGLTGRFGELKNTLKFVRVAIFSFFSDLNKDPVEATRKFMGKIQELFFGYFDPSSPASSKIIDGFKKFGITIFKIFLGFGKWMFDAFKQSFKSFVDNLKGLNKNSEVIKGIKETSTNFIKTFSEYLSSATTDLFNFLDDMLPDIDAAINNLGKMIIDAIKNYFSSTSSTKKMEDSLKIGLMAAFFGVGGSAFGWIVAGLSVGLSASKIDKELGSAIEKKFKGQEINKAGAVAGGKMAASIIDALTFGLLSNNALISIAGFSSNLFDKMINMIEKIYGPMVADAYRDYLKGIFDIFAGIGDVLKAMFSGDGDAVAAGLSKMASGILSILKGLIKHVMGLFHDFFPMVLDFIGKFGKVIMRAIGTLIRGLVIAIWDGLKTLGEGIVKFFTDEKFRTELMKAIGTALTDGLKYLFETIYNFVRSSWGVTVDLFVGLFDGLFKTDILGGKSGKEWVQSIIDKALQMGSDIVSGLANKLSEIKEILKNIAIEALGKLAKVFGIASPSKEMEKVGGHLTDGLGKGLKDLPNVMNDSAVEALNKFSDTMSKLNMEGLNKAQSAITAIKDLLHDLSDIIGSLNNLVVDKLASNLLKISTASTAFSNVAWGDIFAKLGESTSKIDSKVLEDISSKTGVIAEVFKNISGVSSAIATTLDNIGNLSKMDQVINAFKNGLPVINDTALAALNTSQDGLEQYGLTVAAIVEDIKAINESLSNLGEIDIDATIGKVGKALGIEKKLIKIENKPITLNVQLNLTMKAEDIAKEIFDVSAKMVNANPNDPAVKNMAAAFGTVAK